MGHFPDVSGKYLDAAYIMMDEIQYCKLHD